jgi:hypothetical protein
MEERRLAAFPNPPGLLYGGLVLTFTLGFALSLGGLDQPAQVYALDGG